jgi:trehalose/maltose hydrolase-like predicted phosphorylase
MTYARAEYVDHVNDSVYTNYGAKLALNYAAKAAQYFGTAPPSSYQEIADTLVLLFNESWGIHPGTLYVLRHCYQCD